MKEVSDMEQIEMNRENMNDIRYADNATLIADVESKLKGIVDKIVTETERLGLSLNFMKHSAWFY